MRRLKDSLPIPDQCVRLNRVGRACIVVMLALSAHALTASGAETATPTPPPAVQTADAVGPKISCDDSVYDFGTAVNTKPILRTFVLKNTGNAPLEIIGTSTSCGCTVATMEKKSLAPGETAEVKATLALAGKTGAITKSIFVRCNDTSLPQGLFTLTMKGTAVALISVDPISLAWGSVNKAAEETKTLEVQTTLPDVTFKITSVEVKPSLLPTNVSTSIPTSNSNANGPQKITANFTTIEPGKHYQVIVKTVPPLAEGALNYELHIRTDHPDSSDILVRVSGTVLGPISVIPAFIDVPAPDSNARPISRFIRVMPGTAKEFKVLEAKSPVPSITPVINVQPGNVVLIELKNIVPSRELEGKSIVLTTDVPERKEITIPFRLRVLPIIPARLPQAPLSPGAENVPTPASVAPSPPPPPTSAPPAQAPTPAK